MESFFVMMEAFLTSVSFNDLLSPLIRSNRQLLYMEYFSLSFDESSLPLKHLNLPISSISISSIDVDSIICDPAFFGVLVKYFFIAIIVMMMKLVLIIIANMIPC